MEEIKIDFSSFLGAPDALEFFSDMIGRSLEGGVALGCSWNQKVYDYLFESNISEADFAEIMHALGYSEMLPVSSVGDDL